MKEEIHKTTVLITGASGQLGCCIKDLESRHPNLNFIFATREDLDITDKHEVNSFFNNSYIDYCINGAAYTAVDKAEEEHELAFKINAEGPKHLAVACKKHDVVLIHISTDFVFDGKKTEPYTEEDIPNPISVYGASKLQGEIEVQKILKEYFIIRTSWLYSEYGHNFMKTMLRLAETRNEIGVVSDQIGTPTYARDLAELIVHIINSKSKAYGLYHYSNQGITSWYEFAKAIFELSNKTIIITPITTAEYPTAAKRPVYSVLSKKGLQKERYVPVPDWRASLKKAFKRFT